MRSLRKFSTRLIHRIRSGKTAHDQDGTDAVHIGKSLATWPEHGFFGASSLLCPHLPLHLCLDLRFWKPAIYGSRASRAGENQMLLQRAARQHSQPQGNQYVRGKRLLTLFCVAVNSLETEVQHTFQHAHAACHRRQLVVELRYVCRPSWVVELERARLFTPSVALMKDDVDCSATRMSVIQ